MSGWKLQCYFCADTVSTGSLNRTYYKMHLENVHSISQNADQLLKWALSQQNPPGSGKSSGGGSGGGGSSTLSSVASILGMKGITITKDNSSPANGVPNSLINIKGITVQKVSDGTSQPSMPSTPRGRGGMSPAGRGGINRPSAANIGRQQEQAIERWSNACEHGCRLCKRMGKNFTTFHRNTLVRHLETEHNTGERDYKEEFKCQNLITRASNMTCAECKHKVKRIPSSLNAHVKRHGMNIRQYWIKHVAPKGSALATFNPGVPSGGGMANGQFRGQPFRGGRGWMRGSPIPRGARGGGAGGPNFRPGMRPPIRAPLNQATKETKVNGTYQPKVMLNRMDDDTIAREQAGLGGDDAMEVELDPLTLLEMGMGEDVIQLEGVAVKQEVDSSGEGDESTPLASSPRVTAAADETHQKDSDEKKMDSSGGGSRDLVTPDMQEENAVVDEYAGADDDRPEEDDAWAIDAGVTVKQETDGDAGQDESRRPNGNQSPTGKCEAGFNA